MEKIFLVSKRENKNSSPLIVFYLKKKEIANIKNFWYWRWPFREFRISFEHLLPNLRKN